MCSRAASLANVVRALTEYSGLFVVPVGLVPESTSQISETRKAIAKELLALPCNDEKLLSSIPGKTLSTDQYQPHALSQQHDGLSTVSLVRHGGHSSSELREQNNVLSLIDLCFLGEWLITARC